MKSYHFVPETKEDLNRFDLWENPLSEMGCTSVKDAGEWAKGMMFFSKDAPSVLFKRAGKSKKIYRIDREGTITEIFNEKVKVTLGNYPENLQCRLEIKKEVGSEIIIFNKRDIHISDCAKFYESYGVKFWGDNSTVDYKQVGSTGYYSAKIGFDNK